MSGQSHAPASAHRPAVQLSLIAATQILGLSVWFSSSAVLPSLVEEWGITVHEAAWLSMATQVGFVVGAIAASMTGIVDRFRPHLVLGVSALGAAALTAFFTLGVSTLDTAVAVRFLLGICFAGIYPPGLKLTASWALINRSRAFGLLGGCLTLGSALPYLLNAIDGVHWQVLVGATATACAGAGILSLTSIRPGPHLETSKRIDLHYAWRMFRQPGPRAACLGYFGHMFELYAVWTWLPVFMMYSSGAPAMTPELALSVFLCMGASGFAGCVLAGVIAERFGPRKVAVFALSVSGLCCLLCPLVYGSRSELVLAFCAIWGAAVIADSGLFSAMLSSTAEEQACGTALSAQTAIGFLITVVTIQATPVLASLVGWQYAFLYLSLGPLLGVLALTSAKAMNSMSDLHLQRITPKTQF